MNRGNKNNNDNKNFSKRKKSTEDYVFYIGSNKQASDFETTRECMLNHIKRTCECGRDISETLRMQEKIETATWKPKLKVSAKTDPDEKKAEERQFELEHKAELDKAMRREDKCEANSHKACAELWDRCSKSMKAKTEARVDCEKDVCDNPVNLT